MMFIEMSRTEEHGGGTWSFGKCVWAPTRKKDGSSWPFWTKIAQVKHGDIILHLRGITPEAYFVGYSRASGSGIETRSRPPEPGEWAFAEAYYRADLLDYTPFHQPINLAAIFSARLTQLENYLNLNRARGAKRANLFYVRQSDRLQCLNGAYLSDIDEELLLALFGDGKAITSLTTPRPIVSVTTGSQIATVKARLGQTRFSHEIQKLYDYHCCFPDCEVADPRFLVGAHIARWTDNEGLRGHLGNGLCFCLLHDKAFEIGLFTLDEQYRVYVNPRDRPLGSSIVQDLLAQHGQRILLANVVPLAVALREHWIRIGMDPSQLGSRASSESS